MSLDDKSQKLGEALARLRDGLQGLQPAIEAIDSFLSSLGRPLDTELPEVYDKLNWENRTGSKGEFQMLRKDNCNNTQVFSHLEAVLKQNENHISIGECHYWAGDPGYIFRRKKKQEKTRAEK